MDTVVALCLFLLLTGAAVTVGTLVWLVYHFPKRLGQAAALPDLPPLPMPSQETPLSLRERRNRRRLRAQLRAALHLLPLLLLAGCCEPAYPVVAVATLLALGYTGLWGWLRWGGGVLRVRSWYIDWGLNTQRPVWCRIRYEDDVPMEHTHHGTLLGAILAALGWHFPLVVHWGPYPGRIEFVKWSYGTRSSWRHGTAYLRWFKVMWALLLLLSSPALACDGMGPCSAYAQTAAQELAPVSAPNHGSWEPVTAGLNRQDREMVAPPTCEESLQDCRRLAVELHHEEPARWPWALAGLLVGALLGAYLLCRRYAVASPWVSMSHERRGWCAVDAVWTDGRLIWRHERAVPRRFWWQALRDAWRLSREVR